MSAAKRKTSFNRLGSRSVNFLSSQRIRWLWPRRLFCREREDPTLSWTWRTLEDNKTSSWEHSADTATLSLSSAATSWNCATLNSGSEEDDCNQFHSRHWSVQLFFMSFCLFVRCGVSGWLCWVRSFSRFYLSHCRAFICVLVQVIFSAIRIANMLFFMNWSVSPQKRRFFAHPCISTFQWLMREVWNPYTKQAEKPFW